MNDLPRLYVITDRESAARGCGDVFEALEGALEAGARLIQFRDKGVDPLESWQLGRELTALVAAFHASLLVNDRADLATGLAAAGVHRPTRGLPLHVLREILLDTGLLAMSTHTIEEAHAAEEGGADFITLSPIFPTPSKPGYGPALGLETLRLVSSEIDIPIFALGGVRPDNVRACLDAGAHGVAVMGGIMAAADPFEATRDYLEALNV
ncbi:MAG: thiamine phosphate synthase [Bradymonadaceae bacterium]